jgi:hypothetical protein
VEFGVLNVTAEGKGDEVGAEEGKEQGGPEGMIADLDGNDGAGSEAAQHGADGGGEFLDFRERAEVPALIGKHGRRVFFPNEYLTPRGEDRVFRLDRGGFLVQSHFLFAGGLYAGMVPTHFFLS